MPKFVYDKTCGCGIEELLTVKKKCVIFCLVIEYVVC